MAETFKRKDGLRRNADTRKGISQADKDLARNNNPFVVFGSDPSFGNDDLIIFITHVSVVGGGTVVLEDESGGAFTGAIDSPLAVDHDPIEVHGKVTFNGSADIAIAKGYFMQKQVR